MITRIITTNNSCHNFYDLSVHQSQKPVNVPTTQFSELLEKLYDIISQRAEAAAVTKEGCAIIEEKEFPELSLENSEFLQCFIRKLRESYKVRVVFLERENGRQKIAIAVKKYNDFQGDAEARIEAVVQKVIENIKNAAQTLFAVGVELDLTQIISELQINADQIEKMKTCLRERGLSIIEFNDKEFCFRAKWGSHGEGYSDIGTLEDQFRRITRASSIALVTQAYEAILNKISIANQNNESKIKFPDELLRRFGPWGQFDLFIKRLLEDEGFTIEYTGEGYQISAENPIAGRDSERFGSASIENENVDPKLEGSYRYVLDALQEKKVSDSVTIQFKGIPHINDNRGKIIRLLRRRGGFNAAMTRDNCMVLGLKSARGENPAARLLSGSRLN